MMMMIRLDGCMACETDSYRAMRGCAACALQTLRRYKGEDDELITQFSGALEEVQKFAENHTPLGIVTEKADALDCSKRPFEKVDLFHTGRVRDHAPTRNRAQVSSVYISSYHISNGC